MRKANFAVTSYDDGWKAKQWVKRVSDEPTKDLNIDLPRWRNQSRFLHASNPLVFAATQSHANNVIGRGLNVVPKPKGQDKAIVEAIKEAWNSWATSCHIDGQQDLSSTERAIVSAIDRDGDLIAYITINSRKKLVIDLIAGDRLETPPNSLIPMGQDVYGGVAVVKREIVGYWIKNSFSTNGFTYFPAFDDKGRISSVLLRNPSNTDRLNSYRGTPIVSSCLSTIEKLDKLMDAELKSGILKTLQYGILESDSVNDASKSFAPDPSIGLQKVGEANILILPKGNKLTFNSASDISNQTLPATVKLYLNQIASVYDMSSAILFNNLEDNSYSSNSTISLKAWESGAIWRNYLTHNLLIPIYEMLLEMWCAEGTIDATYSKSLAKVEFVGRPNFPIKSKDIYESQEIAIKSGQKSIIQVCSENGLDAFSIVDDAIAVAEYRKSKMDEKGLTETDMVIPEKPIIEPPTQEAK